VNRYFHQVALYITFALLVVLFSSVFFFVQNDKQDKLFSLGDRIIRDFRKNLGDEMANLLSFSLALSEDGELKNSLLKEDEETGYSILSGITQRFKKYTHLKSLRIQVITPDFFIFARSWDEGYEGMPIWWFRDDLDVLNKKREPKVGVETGRLLTFKATVPIYTGMRLLGYLEVITLLDEFADKLRKKGIELFVLMDEKYLNKAELMRDFPRFKNFVLANQNYNRPEWEHLTALPWKRMLEKKYLYNKKRLFLVEPMYNGEEKRIGYYVLVINEEIMKRFEQKQTDIFSLAQFSDEDIGNVVNAWESPTESYRTLDDKVLIELLPKLHREDKSDLERKARFILRTYSKEELIDIILSAKHKEQKTGVIK
jgi:hypothetical protein